MPGRSRERYGAASIAHTYLTYLLNGWVTCIANLYQYKLPDLNANDKMFVRLPRGYVPDTRLGLS